MEEIDIMQEGVNETLEKHELQKQMAEVAKEYCDRTGGEIDKKTMIAIKDYLHYRGRNWGETCLDKADKESKVKYPDRVAPAFRRILEMVTNCGKCHRLDILDVYIEELKNRGIAITIDESRFLPQNDNSGIVNECYEIINGIQTEICSHNDRIVEELAPEAEANELAPKKKFKELSEMAYRIQNSSKGKSDKLIERINHEKEMNMLHNAALNEL